MSIVGYRASNHPQQVGRRGALGQVDDRATHPDDFAAWNSRFGGFTLDVAAAAHNAKCARYFTIEQDGLTQSWAGERVWCNPPYSRIDHWVQKAWDEHVATQGIVMLLPANRTEQGWWQDLVEFRRDEPRSPLTVEFLRGRLRFIQAGRTEVGPNERPPFGCCLLIWKGSLVALPTPDVCPDPDGHADFYRTSESRLLLTPAHWDAEARAAAEANECIYCGKRLP